MQGCFVGQRRDMQATHGHVGTSLSVAVGNAIGNAVGNAVGSYRHGRHWSHTLVCTPGRARRRA